MKYLDWNNLLASYFFNEKYSEKEVNLFITKDEIIQIGKASLEISDEVLVWKDFVKAILDDLSDNHNENKLIVKANDWFTCFNRKRNYFEFPPYLVYLVLSIYPFTEFDEKINGNSYYVPVNTILERDGLPKWTPLNSQYNWIRIWEDLEEWSILDKNLQLGYFEYHKNTGHIYIDYPRTQSLLQPIFYRKLKLLLFEQEIESFKINSLKQVQLIVLEYSSFLGLKNNVVEIVENESHHLNSTLLNKIFKFIKEWDGIVETEEEIGSFEFTSNKVFTKFKLCFEIYEEYKVKYYYRLYSKADYPTDLEFKSNNQLPFPVVEEYNGWSKRINLDLKNYSLFDSLNNWKVNYTLKNIILFTEGSRYGLNNFIEVDYLEPGNTYFVLIRKNFPEVEEIIIHYSNDNNGIIINRSEDFENIPEDYDFYQIKNIKTEFKPHINIVKSENIQIEFVKGIKIRGRKFLKYIVPNVLVEGINPESKLIACFKNSGEEVELRKENNEKVPIWELKNAQGKQLNYDSEFEIFSKDSENNKIKLGKGTYELLSSDKAEITESIPIFDKYFHQVTTEEENLPYYKGNSFINNYTTLKENQNYQSLESKFQPKGKENIDFPRNSSWYYDPNRDLLLNFLSIKGKVEKKEFAEAFKTIYSRDIGINENDNINYLWRTSLNYYFNLGHISIYGKNRDKIIINPPQLIQMPSDIFPGAKFLIVGARTKKILDSIIDFCQKNRNNFNISYETQEIENKNYVLPGTLILRLNCSSKDELAKKISEILNHIEIQYQYDIINSLGLLAYCGSIVEYGNSIIPDPNKQVFNITKIKNFNPVDCKFKISNEAITNNSRLTEYEFNPYTYICKYYKNGKSYSVDKSLGIYLSLSENRKRPIIHNVEHNFMLVFATSPLPPVYERIIAYFSGKCPLNVLINNRRYNKYVDIDNDLSKLLIRKLNQ